ncbi:hypothetical protein O3P69_020840 [Scylla paramamosain]|uniref:Uncharacterized protein n=1 Tax=Scylla paramamosain TaxID=85552 RepID=A0AAW0TNX1_SCYPA
MKTKVLELSDNNNLTTHPPPQQQPPTTEVSAVNHQRRAWSRSAPSRAGPGRSQKRCKGCGDSGISALTAPASLKTSAHPLSPPYELVEENLGRLEKWLLEEFGRTVFATERTPLPEILSPPHHIHLRPGARPHVVHVPATVPHHFYNEVRRQLDDDIARGIIEEVPAGEPTEWLTGWLEVEHLSGEATSSRLITLFRRWFTRFGIPEELVTKYLNTPLHGLDASPAQLPTGKQLRDAIPVESSRYLINEQWGRTLRDRERAMIQTSVNSSIRHDQQAHSLTPLRPGQRARIQKPI